MIGLREVVDRALSGPLCSESDFDMERFVPSLRKAVRKYAIKYDPEHPVPADDDLADRVFQAAVDVYAAVGTYCFGAERIIQFSRAEIEEQIKNAPRSTVLGHGQEAKSLVGRRPESTVPPWVSIGAGGAGVSDEETFVSLMEAYARNPLADSLTTPTLSTIDGRTIAAGTPLEMEGAIRTVVLAKEIVQKAGRPGLPIANCIATAASAEATIAGSQFGLSPTDAWEIASMPELKVDLGVLNKVTYVSRIGGRIWDGATTIMGGYAGGPEGTAVAVVANYLASLFIKQACCYHPYPMHYSRRCTTDRAILWAISVATQAESRNCAFPTVNLGYTAAGPGTLMCLYEAAAWAIASVVSGGSIEAIGTASNAHMDHLSPLEPTFAAEAAYAAAGMSRREADEVVNRLLSCYEAEIAQPPLGQRYQQCCDLATGRPTAEWAELYRRAREHLATMGLQFRFAAAP